MLVGGLVILLVLPLHHASGKTFQSEPHPRMQIIPILATTLDQHSNPIGVVAEIRLSLTNRHDHNGMDIEFQTVPGKFSPAAQIAVLGAIINIARVTHLNTDSLSVSLTVPYQGVTVYGTSLSAMIGVAVVALAHGDFIKPYRVLTGTIAPDGHIGAVAGIDLKLKAAHEHHLRRVLVPDEYDQADGDWNTPFLLHVSPIRSVTTAYRALTDRVFPGESEVDPG